MVEKRFQNMKLVSLLFTFLVLFLSKLPKVGVSFQTLINQTKEVPIMHLLWPFRETVKLQLKQSYMEGT